MSLSSVLSSISPPVTPTAKSANGTVSKDDFLKLLVTQLQKQDPLNPQDPTEFTSQLTQFSSLEQLMQVNDSIKGLSDQQALGSQLGSTSFIGRTARVSGNSVSVAGGVAGPLHYELPADSTKTTINVYDGSNNLVNSIELGPQTTGAHDYTWTGTNSAGTALPNGSYRMEVAAQDAKENNLTATTSTTGLITSVSFENGITMLTIGGKSYPLTALETVS